MEDVRALHDKMLAAKSLEIGNAMAAHVDNLLSQHRKEIEGVQLYFENITLSNLNRIRTLEKNIEELQASNTSVRLCRLRQHNQRVLTPIRALTADKERLTRELDEYLKETQEYVEVKRQLRKVGEAYDRSSFHFEVLTQKLDLLRQEATIKQQRDQEVHSKRSRRSEFRALLSEKRNET
jgi:hypothetical protein